jgi:hypothetical protein
VNAIALDGDTVYFSDCETLYSLPKSGGFPVTLTSVKGCSSGNLFVDGDSLYLLQTPNQAPGEIIRVPRTGGASAVVVAMSEIPFSFAVDNDNIYWISQTRLKRTPKAGGTIVTMSTSVTQYGMPRMLVSGGYVYWLQGSSVSRLATSTSEPTNPANVPLGQTGAWDFGIDAAGVYFTVPYGDQGSLMFLPWSGGAASELVGNIKGAGTLALDAAKAYYRDNNSIRAVPKTGGSATTVAGFSSIGAFSQPLVVDDAAVFWGEGTKLMKVAK